MVPSSLLFGTGVNIVCVAPMKWLRHPTVQFFVAFILSPMSAALGDVLDSPDSPISTRWAGWMATLILWAAFGIRSARYEWQRLPRATGSRRPSLTTASLLEFKVLFAIALVTVLSAIAALILSGMLAVQPFARLDVAHLDHANHQPDHFSHSSVPSDCHSMDMDWACCLHGMRCCASLHDHRICLADHGQNTLSAPAADDRSTSPPVPRQPPRLIAG